MGRIAVLVASLALALPAVPSAAAGRAAARRNQPQPVAKGARTPSLAEATEAMKAVMRDPERRNYRQNWERAINGLLSAARGESKAAAWLEAGRARWALYRWSANESDREKALILANRAVQLGSAEGRQLAAAIRSGLWRRRW